jgi:hypothetical protein
MKDGLLRLRVKAPIKGEIDEIAIEPLSDGEAILAGVLAEAGETIQVTRLDDVEIFRYSGYLFKRKGK